MKVQKWDGSSLGYQIEVPDNLETLLRNAGATDKQVERAMRHIERRKWAPGPINMSTPANTSNVMRDVVELTPGLFWVHTSGWTGDRDELNDEVWVVKE